MRGGYTFHERRDNHAAKEPAHLQVEVPPVAGGTARASAGNWIDPVARCLAGFHTKTAALEFTPRTAPPRLVALCCVAAARAARKRAAGPS